MDVPLVVSAKDLVPATKVELEAGCPRLKTICDAYGDIHIIELVEMVEGILTFMSSYEEMEKLFDRETAQRLEREGHLTHWSKEVTAFSANKYRILESYEASGS